VGDRGQCGYLPFHYDPAPSAWDTAIPAAHSSNKKAKDEHRWLPAVWSACRSLYDAGITLKEMVVGGAKNKKGQGKILDLQLPGQPAGADGASTECLTVLPTHTIFSIYLVV